jgi:hypothetical protein
LNVQPGKFATQHRSGLEITDVRNPPMATTREELVVNDDETVSDPNLGQERLCGDAGRHISKYLDILPAA